MYYVYMPTNKVQRQNYEILHVAIIKTMHIRRKILLRKPYTPFCNEENYILTKADIFYSALN